MLKTRSICTVFLIWFSSIMLVGQTYSRASLWEKEIAGFKATDQQEFPSEGQILFVGSSTFRGWRSVGEDFSDFNVINRAFGGSQFSDLIYYFFDVVYPYRPCQIIVYEGDNDIASGMDPDVYLQDVITFVRIAEIFLPGTTIGIVSTKPSPSREKWTRQYGYANRLVREFSLQKPHVRFIDIEQLFLDQKGQIIPDFFIGDMLHLNRKGYELLIEVIRPYLSELGRKEAIVEKDGDLSKNK